MICQRKLRATIIMAFATFSPANLLSQAMYLPPAYRVTLPANTPVLQIQFKDGGSIDRGTKVLIDDSHLVLVVPKRGRDVILLSNRTIGAVADDLQSKYPNDLVVTALYPLQGTQHLRPEPIPKDIPFTALASSGEPTVAIGFGVVFAMADADAPDRNGLLSQTGFQLDLAGVHQLRGPQAGPARMPILNTRLPLGQVYLQARLGLNSDQDLNVVSTDSAGVRQDPNNKEPGTQVEDALEQADQIALTVQSEFVYPLTGGSELSIVPEYGQTWTRLERYAFPVIHIGGAPQNSEQFFDPELRAVALRQLNQTVPLRNWGASIVLRFIHRQKPLFHIGGGYVHKQVVHRGIRFSRDPATSRPVSTSLSADIRAPDHGFWRGVFGARIPGVIDIRMDAVTPMSRKVGPPVLRLVLSKDFPIAN